MGAMRFREDNPGRVGGHAGGAMLARVYTQFWRSRIRAWKGGFAHSVFVLHCRRCRFCRLWPVYRIFDVGDESFRMGDARQ